MQTALRVSELESGLVANRHNGNALTFDDSWGCFQVNRFGPLALSRPPAAWLIDPVNNTQYAIKLYQAHGWTPWSNTARKLGLPH